MAKAKDRIREEVAAKPVDSGRASDAAPEASGLPLHPLMAHPAAALAAMTAVGFGFATQMASAFLGSLQGALEATETLARKVEDEKGREERPAPPSESAAKTATRKPAAKVKGAAKVPVAKAPVAKAARPKSVEATPAVAAPKAASPKPAKAVSRGRGKADDLKKISGIGPKLEQILNGMGITRFADIAGWSDEDVARIDAEIGLGGRIVRDGWVAQAKALKEGGA